VGVTSVYEDIIHGYDYHENPIEKLGHIKAVDKMITESKIEPSMYLFFLRYSTANKLTGIKSTNLETAIFGKKDSLIFEYWTTLSQEPI
jgi:hypothetical protein